MSDLFGIAIEQLRFSTRGVKGAAKGPLCRLTPARVGNLWINIGIKTIVFGRHLIPRRQRERVGDFNLNDGLDAFEAVLPWND